MAQLPTMAELPTTMPRNLFVVPGLRLSTFIFYTAEINRRPLYFKQAFSSISCVKFPFLCLYFSRLFRVSTRLFRYYSSSLFHSNYFPRLPPLRRRRRKKKGKCSPVSPSRINRLDILYSYSLVDFHDQQYAAVARNNSLKRLAYSN